MGVGICRVDYPKRGTLHLKAQVRSDPVAQTGTKKPTATSKAQSAISLLLQTQLPTDLQAEPGTRDSLGTFSSKTVFLQSPCPGGPGDLLNDHGFGYLLPQGHLMHLALVGSRRHLHSGRKPCPSSLSPGHRAPFSGAVTRSTGPACASAGLFTKIQVQLQATSLRSAHAKSTQTGCFHPFFTIFKGLRQCFRAGS